MNKDSLGDRMKRYEDVSRIFLTRRIPVIARIDGKAFHTLTRGMKKPFDDDLRECMNGAAKELFGEVQGVKLAYVQSDEISLLLHDYDDLQTESWFASNLQKMASVSAALTTYYFGQLFRNRFPHIKTPAVFDARFFTLPKEEVCNYFIWRQQDAMRNSVSMLAQSLFPHKQLQGVSSLEAKEMMKREKGVDWDTLPAQYQRGVAIYRISDGMGIATDKYIPVFTQDRDFIDRHVFTQEGAFVNGAR